MTMYTSRSLSNFGAFGASAPELFPGGPTFVGGDDQGVFYGMNTGFTSGAKQQGFNWVPANDSMRTKAANKWALLSAPDVSDKDRAYKDAMQQKLSTLLNSFYGAVGNHSALGYSGDATQQVVYIGDQLKAAMRQIAAYAVTPPTLEESLPADINASHPSEHASAVQSSSVSYPGSGGGSSSSSGGSMLPIILGLGGIAALAAILLLRKRPKAVAGYRRRRRR